MSTMSLKPPLKMSKPHTKDSVDRSWRPNQFQRRTQTNDLLKVSLGFAWMWEVLVHVPWDTVPHFAWSDKDYATAEEAMAAADEAVVEVRKTTSEEEYETKFRKDSK
jgi:hypothetical protein